MDTVQSSNSRAVPGIDLRVQHWRADVPGVDNANNSQKIQLEILFCQWNRNLLPKWTDLEIWRKVWRPPIKNQRAGVLLDKPSREGNHGENKTQWTFEIGQLLYHARCFSESLVFGSVIWPQTSSIFIIDRSKCKIIAKNKDFEGLQFVVEIPEITSRWALLCTRLWFWEGWLGTTWGKIQFDKLFEGEDLFLVDIRTAHVPRSCRLLPSVRVLWTSTSPHKSALQAHCARGHPEFPKITILLRNYWNYGYLGGTFEQKHHLADRRFRQNDKRNQLGSSQHHHKPGLLGSSLNVKNKSK